MSSAPTAGRPLANRSTLREVRHVADSREREPKEQPIERTGVQARQGGRSLLSLRVLVWSLAIAFGLLAVLYLLFFPVI